MNTLKEKCYRILEVLATWCELEVAKNETNQECGKLYLEHAPVEVCKDPTNELYAIAMNVVNPNNHIEICYPFGRVYYTLHDLSLVMEGMILVCFAQGVKSLKLTPEGKWEITT